MAYGRDGWSRGQCFDADRVNRGRADFQSLLSRDESFPAGTARAAGGSVVTVPGVPEILGRGSVSKHIPPAAKAAIRLAVLNGAAEAAPFQSESRRGVFQQTVKPRPFK